MKNVNKLFLIGALIALISVFAVPALAQDVAPGEGGIIVEGNFGGDIQNLNVLIANDTASNRVIGLIMPGLIGVDPETQYFTKNDPAALVTDWTVSEDNLVYTFTIRTDWVWSDGDAITSADVQYAWDAISSGGFDTPYGYLTSIIESVTTPTEDTYVVTFKQADCSALGYSSLPIVPSHVFPTDYAEITNMDYNLSPSVTGGVFNFNEFRPGEQVSVVANQEYKGAANGVIPTGFIYKGVADQNVIIEQFLAGELSIIDSPSVGRLGDLEADADAGNTVLFPYPGRSWDYLAFNHADPANPKAAWNIETDTATGEDQGKHPIFGDVRVRQAISHAVDVDAIIQGAVFGRGIRMNAFLVPSSWAYPADLPFIELNLEKAAALLDEAGWVDDDNDPATPRVAKGAMYAADGTPLRFTLYTNEGNVRRTAIGTIVQDELKQVGIEVDFQTIEFNTILDRMDAQDFDAIILGWRDGFPSDPDQSGLFTTNGDYLGGNNFTSFSNARVDELMKQAATVPGCAQEERAAIYAEIQGILQSELPYVPLYAINGYYAGRSNVENFAPYPNMMMWNIDTWIVKSTP